MIILYFLSNIMENNEKSMSTTESDKDEEIMDTQDSYVLTLSQKAVTESQSDNSENEFHETLFEECSQVC